MPYLRLRQMELTKVRLGCEVRSLLSVSMLIIVTILKRSSRDAIVCRAVLLRSSDKGMLGKGRVVSVAVAEGVSEGQEVDHMKPCIHAGSNHLASGTSTGGSTSAVLCLM